MFERLRNRIRSVRANRELRKHRREQDQQDDAIRAMVAWRAMQTKRTVVGNISDDGTLTIEIVETMEDRP